MHSSVFFLAASLAALTSALPSPVELAPRCGTTLKPFILQQFSTSQPDKVFPNSITPGFDGSFDVEQDSNGDELLQGAAFQVPPGSFGCQLQFTFDSSFVIDQTQQATMNVSTLAIGHSDDITPGNSISFNALINTPGALDTGLFGTVGPVQVDQTTVVNSEACPSDLPDGSGVAAFLFEIASFVQGDQHFTFDQTDTNGIFLVFDC